VQGNDLIFLVLERSATSILQLDPATYDRFSEIFTGINLSKAPSATAWMIDDEGPRCLWPQWTPIFTDYPVLLPLAPSEVQRLYREERLRPLPILIYQDRFTATYSLPSLSNPRLRSERQHDAQVRSHRYRLRTLSNSGRRARSPFRQPGNGSDAEHDEVTISASESANEQFHGPSLIESADEQFHQPSSTVRQTVAKGMRDSVGVRTRAQACSQRAADIGSLENSGPADRADEDAESDSEVEPAPTTGNRKRASPKKVLEPRKRHAAMKMRAQAREQLAAVIDLDSASEHSSFAASAHKGADSEDEAKLASTTGKRKRVDEQETTEASRPRKKVKKARNATAPAPAPVTQPAQPVPVPQPVVVPLPAGPQAAGPPPAVPQPATIPQPAAASQTAAVP
jgi:hypothetical protein